jgi:hypothetical protein
MLVISIPGVVLHRHHREQLKSKSKLLLKFNDHFPTMYILRILETIFEKKYYTQLINHVMWLILKLKIMQFGVFSSGLIIVVISQIFCKTTK